MMKRRINALSNAQTRNQVIKEVCKETGFKIEKVIYHHYDGEQIERRSISGLVFTGKYSGKKTILKLHGLEEESYDAEMIEKFNSQNESKIIGSPKVYENRKWNRSLGYGYMLMEYIDAPRICNSPFATSLQRKDFAKFYEEYKTKAVTKPWIPRPKVAPTISTFAESIELWRTKAETIGRIPSGEYVQYLNEFCSIAEQEVKKIPIKFMHGHLYPEHVLKRKNGSYVILDHMSWMYRLEWADLSYMIWRLMLDIRNNEYSRDKFIGYAEGWIRLFKQIPIVKKDSDFDRKMRFLLLERSIGSMIGDLGTGKYWGSREGMKYLKHRLLLQQNLFEHIYKNLV